MQIAKSLSQYLSAVRLIRKRWGIPRSQELWFRAEDLAHRHTHLQPGLYRPRKSGVRKSVETLLRLENELYEEFRRCASQLSDGRLTDDADPEWDSYFLMQHYGVPTRILDWSDGALIALHFAIRNKPRPPRSGSIIYVLNPYWLLSYLERHANQKDAEERWEKFRVKHPEYGFDEDDSERLYLPSDEDDEAEPLLATPIIPMLWDSPHLTRRVAAQRSRFIIFGTDPQWLANIAQETDARLVSITVPLGAISKIKQELRDAGITESVVFPDLDGLGRELRQVWESRR